MTKTTYLNVQGVNIAITTKNHEDFICLSDMARYKNNEPFLIIAHWMRTRNTIEYLAAWEMLHNGSFKPTEIGRFLNEAGSNRFMFSASPQRIGAIRILICRET